MNWNLYRKELKRNRKNLIIWSAIVIAFTIMVTSIFPFMQEMGESMSALMDKMPAELSKAMGMDSETWSSILGFYSTYYGIYIIVLVSIYTTSTGATIISKEEKDQTSEFLMTKPISRLEIFKTKMLALFTLSLIIYLVQAIVALISLSLFKSAPVNWEAFAIMHVGGLILMLFFTCVGVILSMFVTPKKNFMGMVVGITFGSYFINAIGQAADAVNWVSYFSPFHYLSFQVNDPNYSVNYLGALALLAIGTLMLYLSFQKYKKKDIAG
ncbi:MAG: ABC-2 type transport system permease protein [Crocinitomix sp.]|jgi:ABC-2 type transport system permease protein